MRNLFVSFFMGLTALSGVASAQDLGNSLTLPGSGDEMPNNAFGVQGLEASIGAGVLFSPKYPGSGVIEVRPVPLVTLEKDFAQGIHGYLRGTQAGADYMVSDRLSVGLLGNYRFERDNDDLEVRGMRKIDGAVELGPKLRFQATRDWGVEGTWLQDVSGAHDGNVAHVGTDYVFFRCPNWKIAGAAGISYGSKDFNDAYFGVNSSEARPDRRSYFIGDGFNAVDVGVTSNYMLTQHIALTSMAGADLLIGDARKSPLVEQDVQPKVMVGMAYRF